ncbi:MAG TPA: ubiquitin, partial [Desulfobacteria bacterium]|nr:ubiquitin [Desulfobacteria bacterium]
MTNLEQVEKLCAMANISYEEAKAALDAANGDLLDAIIYLEKQGKVHAPTGGGYYSSEKTVDAGAVSDEENSWERQGYKNPKENSFIAFLKKSWKFSIKMIRKGNINSFEVLKGEEIKASFPVTVL